MNYFIDKKLLIFLPKFEHFGRGWGYRNSISVQQSNKKINESLTRAWVAPSLCVLPPFFIAVADTAAAREAQASRRGRVADFPVSAFLLSYRPSLITKSCDFLACAVPVDGEEGVGGRRVQWGRRRACQEVVDGDLRGPWELHLLELWGMVLLLHQLVQEGLVLLRRELLGVQELLELLLLEEHLSLLVRQQPQARGTVSQGGGWHGMCCIRWHTGVGERGRVLGYCDRRLNDTI